MLPNKGSRKKADQKATVLPTAGSRSGEPYQVYCRGEIYTVFLLFMVTIGDRMWMWLQPNLFFMSIDNANCKGIILRD